MAAADSHHAACLSLCTVTLVVPFSINTVLFALQLLFLEPWPAASAHSATASSMPPARPVLTGAHSAPVAPSSDSSLACPSALSLAASRSAAASSLHQLDEGGILNLDIYKLIVGGERAVFEELVRKTLDGGFFFGALWPRNRAAQHDSDSEGDDDGSGSDDERGRFRRARSPSPVDESRYDPRHMFSNNGGGGDGSNSSFDALLRRVEQNGRQAHVGAVDSHQQPQQRDRRRASRGDHAMDSDSDGHSGAANGAVAPAHKPQSHLSSSGVPSNGGKGVQKRSKRLLHRKRAHRLISSSDAHEHNPAASLCASSPSMRMMLPGVDAADLPTHVHKRIRSQQLALEACIGREGQLQQQQHPNAVIGSSSMLRVAATSRRRIIQLRPLPGMADSSGRAPVTRKRPSPLPASLSDGEYEDAAEAEVAAVAALGAPRRNPSPTAAQDDSSAVPRRRRAKKQFRPATSEDDGDGDRMHGSLAPFGMGTDAAASANGTPRPSSTVLPDLASFASFHPTSPPLPLGRSVSPPQSHTATAASLSDGAQSSNSPKRNVSDCGSLMPSLLTLDERGARYGAAGSEAAGASFILHGRSSSRSLNLFGSGPVKARTGSAAGAGLADLKDLHASLPAAALNAMVD